MHKYWFMALAAVASVAVPSLAQAAPAIATANVNMRSGPSTRYPAVFVVPAGSRVDIRGCMSSANWCDVSVAGYRGWMSGSYLQTRYSQRRVYVEPEYYRPLGIPTVTFSVGRYWDDHYRDRSFYRERDRWSRGPDWRDDRRRPDRGRPDRGHGDDWRGDGGRHDDWRGDGHREDHGRGRDRDRDWGRHDDNRDGDRHADRRDRDRPVYAEPQDDRDRHPIRRHMREHCAADPESCQR